MVAKLRLARTLAGPRVEAPADRLSFSPTGSHLLVATRDGPLRRWDLTSKAAPRTIALAATPGSFAHLAGDQAAIAFRALDGKLTLVDLATGAVVKALGPKAHMSISLEVSADRSTAVVVPGDTGRLVVWDLATRKAIATFKNHQFFLDGFAISSNGRRALSLGGYDGTLRCWDATTGKERWCLRADRRHPWFAHIALAPDGTAFSSWSAHEVAVYPTRKTHTPRWRHDAGYPTQRADDERQVRAVTWAPDGAALHVGRDADLAVLDAATGAVVASWALPRGAGRIAAVASRPDGGQLAVGLASGAVLLVDLARR